MLTQFQAPVNLTFLSSFFAIFFKLETLTLETNFLCFLFWLLFFIDISKPIAAFSAFSKATSWFIGFCLACVFALSGWIAKIVAFLINSFSFIVALIIILLFFIGAYIFEALISIKLKKQKRLKEMMEEEKGKLLVREIGKSIK